MKIFKKAIAFFAVICIMISSVTAFAAFSTITTSQTVDTIAAGETITISATFDTLANAKGIELKFGFDSDAFAIDTADDTEYNFGSTKKPVYWPNYIDDAVKEERAMGADGMYPFFGGVWDTFTYNATETSVNFVAYGSDGATITEADVAEDMYPDNTIGVVFNAKADIKPGTYTFTIDAIVSDATVGDIKSSKTATVTVAGAPDPDPEKEYQTKVTPKTTLDAEVDGEKVTYTNVAIYEIKCALVEGAKGYGFTFAHEGVITKDFEFGTELSGEGSFDYVLAISGVTDANLISATPYAWVVK